MQLSQLRCYRLYTIETINLYFRLLFLAHGCLPIDARNMDSQATSWLFFSTHICPYGSIDTYTVAYFKIYVEVAPNSLVNVAYTVSPYESIWACNTQNSFECCSSILMIYQSYHSYGSSSVDHSIYYRWMLIFLSFMFIFINGNLLEYFLLIKKCWLFFS